jgi:CheY-like chemotaxis protein
MDCQMPDLDGYVATRRIRELEIGGVRVPIVALGIAEERAAKLDEAHWAALSCSAQALGVPPCTPVRRNEAVLHYKSTAEPMYTRSAE